MRPGYSDDLMYCPDLVDLLCGDLADSKRFRSGEIRQELEHRSEAAVRIRRWIAEMEQLAAQEELSLEDWAARQVTQTGDE